MQSRCTPSKLGAFAYVMKNCTVTVRTSDGPLGAKSPDPHDP